jgi:hypothetical protein
MLRLSKIENRKSKSDSRKPVILSEVKDHGSFATVHATKSELRRSFASLRMTTRGGQFRFSNFELRERPTSYFALS